MLKKAVETGILRPGNRIYLPAMVFGSASLLDVLSTAGITVANVSEDMKDFYAKHWRKHPNMVMQNSLQTGVVRHRLPDDCVNELRFRASWMQDFLRSLSLQGNGEEGELLTNGTSNGCVFAEDFEWAGVARWHDPRRPYGANDQTAVWPDPGWSIGIVSSRSRAFCNPGMKVLFSGVL